MLNLNLEEITKEAIIETVLNDKNELITFYDTTNVKIKDRQINQNFKNVLYNIYTESNSKLF